MTSAIHQLDVAAQQHRSMAYFQNMGLFWVLQDSNRIEALQLP